MPASRPRLELVWPGKDQFLLTPTGEDGKPVWVEPDHPAAHEVRLTELTGAYGQINEADPYTDNLVFTGDSLDVLRVLCEVPEYRQHYRGKVKLIYIDPPFNTGQTFAHYDDWMEHSTWLSFMRDRLLLMKELLSPDGTIWVHLDDAEQHRMKCLLDEVLGADNFVATICWQRVDNARQRLTTGIPPAHDMLHVYGSMAKKFVANREDAPEEMPSHFSCRDSEGRYYQRLTLRKTGSNSLRTDRPSMWFSISAPDGSTVWPVKTDGTQGRWRWSKETYEQRGDEIEWASGSDGSLQPYTRNYYAEDTQTPFTSWWAYTEVGSNRMGNREIKALFPDIPPFSTPKPERLLHRIIHIGSNPGDTVVDVFGGSGTTSAVAQKMGRHWVTAELSTETVAKFIVPR